MAFGDSTERCSTSCPYTRDFVDGLLNIMRAVIFAANDDHIFLRPVMNTII